MSVYTPYVDGPDRVLPTSVRALRVLLYVGAVITVLTTFGYLASEGLTGATVGQAVWNAWPGVVGLFIARKVLLGGRRRFWVIVVVAAFWILGALGAIGRGDPRGVTELILPIAVLVALTRRSSRDYFLR